MNANASGVAISAAMIKSPSFSLSDNKDYDEEKKGGGAVESVGHGGGGEMNTCSPTAVTCLHHL